ncbi:ATP synthase subunit I [Maridesulfovibrio sp.]|uniref:ATP synthase subunit I n=1 Tax=Maridesulfovibrio sp. TaxID=2795000 RepID=UPI002A189C2C|nr:ATP synthase subunit I [Maridesulfovibrio sp.]
MQPVSSLMITFAAFGIGLLIAAFHFGGLWLTLRMLPVCARPRIFFWSSYLARYAVTLWGFAQVMAFGGYAWIASFLGFYLMRAFMLSRASCTGFHEFFVFKRPSWK